jgi:hypothetical protein
MQANEKAVQDVDRNLTGPKSIILKLEKKVIFSRSVTILYCGLEPVPECVKTMLGFRGNDSFICIID